MNQQHLTELLEEEQEIRAVAVDGAKGAAARGDAEPADAESAETSQQAGAEATGRDAAAGRWQSA